MSDHRFGRPFPRGGALPSLSTLFLALSLTGCGPLVGVGPSADPTPVPRRGVEIPAPDPTPLATLVAEDVPGIVESLEADPILESPWAQAEGMEEEVQRWIESFQGPEADLFRETLVRMGRYQEMVDQELRVRRLPPSLAYLPIIESWYSPGAVSWVGAAGLWQFMPPTARGLGLTVNRLVDERRDPFQATPRALDFLAQLRDQFGSWFLALAAYNGGPGRVDRVLRRRAPGEVGHDGLFLNVRGDLPRETRNFIPRFLAAARIARDPAAYGFEDVLPDPALAFDEVELPDATSLDVVARAAGAELKTLERLNPQLLRGLTPAGVPTRVRVPQGKGATFATNYALIPPEERVTFAEHLVAQGETLSHIARSYVVTVDDLLAANPQVEPRRLKIGQRIIVPKAPSVREGLRGVVVDGPARRASELLVYTVRPGDTLGDIAARHRVSLGEILQWNQLTRDAVIRPGDEVRIFVIGGD